MRSHKKSIVAIAAATLVVVGSTVSFAGQRGTVQKVSSQRQWIVVRSATRVPACNAYGSNNTICIFKGTNFNGDECQFNADAYQGLGWTNIGPNLCTQDFDNDMESWINNSPHDAKWATDSGGDGTTRCMNAGGQNDSVSPANAASSIRVFSSSTVCS